jgi:PBP1b-binding outer membrane lipoprotein LpoB
MVNKLMGLVIIIVIGALAVAGCTTPATSPSPSPSATHDPLLEQYVDAFNQTMTERHPNNLTAWRVTWNNSTAVQIQDSFTYHPSYSNTTTTQYVETNTLIKFGSVDEATKYVDSHSQGYQLVSTKYNQTTNQTGAYQRLTGYAPTVYSSYTKDGNSIEHIDQFVWVGEYSRISMS